MQNFDTTGGGADLSGDVVAVERQTGVAGRALTAEVASRGSVLSLVVV